MSMCQICVNLVLFKIRAFACDRLPLSSSSQRACVETVVWKNWSIGG
ncbi:hypothetical protein HanPSC8_Chr05g0204651 [Helianthus annuus]|nr:hypothetical protein HanPSC8_Chr05g0204651 [Helianthus annuus]